MAYIRETGRPTPLISDVPAGEADMPARTGVPLVSRSPGAHAYRASRGPGMQALIWLLPFLVMAALVGADLSAGPSIGFLPLLSLGPALAAVSRSPAQTALIGLLAVVLCVLLAGYDGLQGSPREIIDLVTICGVTAVGVIASVGRLRRERELADVRAVAEVAQRVLLHPLPRAAGHVQMAVRYISASASARIGGDLYAVVMAAGNVRLIVGDVQGKGLTAVQTAATVLGAFREAAYDAADLALIAARIELSLERQAAGEKFVTAILAQLPVGGSEVEILSCGHPPPLLLRGGAVRFIDPPEAGLPLGLRHLATGSREPRIVSLEPGDRMLFYTDGVSEARDKSGEFYPLDGCGALLDGQDLDTGLDRLRDDVTRYVGHALRDDAAMLLISSGPPSPRVAGSQLPEILAAGKAPAASQGPR